MNEARLDVPVTLTVSVRNLPRDAPSNMMIKLQDRTSPVSQELQPAHDPGVSQTVVHSRCKTEHARVTTSVTQGSMCCADENAEAMAVMSKHIVELQEEVEQLKAGLASAEAAGVAAQQAHASEAAALKAGAEQRYSALENALQTQVAELKAARDAVECAADESSRLAAVRSSCVRCQVCISGMCIPVDTMLCPVAMLMLTGAPDWAHRLSLRLVQQRCDSCCVLTCNLQAEISSYDA